MPQFDFQAARRDGYSEDEIKQFLLSQPGVSDAESAGYSPEEILSHFGYAPPTTLQNIANKGVRGLEIAAGGVAKGLAATAGLPGTLEAVAREHGMLPEVPAGSGPSGVVHNLMNLPTSQDLVNALGSFAGPEPRSTAEKYISGAAQGIGGTLPLLPVVGPTAVLLGGAGSGAAAEAAHEMFPESTVAPLAAGAIGGLVAESPLGALGLVAARKAMQTAEGTANLKNAVTATFQEAADRAAGLKNDLLGEKTQLSLAHKKALAEANDLHEQNLNSAGAAAAEQLGKLTQATEDSKQALLASLGGAKTQQQTGEAIQKPALKWAAGIKDKIDSEMGAIREAAPAGTTVDLTDSAALMNRFNSRGGPALAPAMKLIQGSLPGNLQSTFQSILEGQKTGMVPPISLKEAMNFRSQIGSVLRDPKLFNDTKDVLSPLYAQLTNSIREALPEDLRPQWDTANANTHAMYEYGRNTIAPIIGNKLDGSDVGSVPPEDVVDNVLRNAEKGGTRIANLRKELPEATDALAAHLIQYKGDDWLKLAPEAREALLPGDPLTPILENHAAQAQEIEAARKSAVDQSAQAVNQLSKTQAQEMFDLQSRIADAKLNSIKAAAALKAAKQESFQANSAVAGLAKTAENSRSKSIQRSLESLTGAIGGEALAKIIPNMLGLSGPIPGIGMIGEAVPLAAHTIGRVIDNPALIRRPLMGAIAGNPLRLEEEPER